MKNSTRRVSYRWWGVVGVACAICTMHLSAAEYFVSPQGADDAAGITLSFGGDARFDLCRSPPLFSEHCENLLAITIPAYLFDAVFRLVWFHPIVAGLPPDCRLLSSKPSP